MFEIVMNQSKSSAIMPAPVLHFEGRNDHTIKPVPNYSQTHYNLPVRIAGIANDSIVDGPGIRLAVFAQGCQHNCIGCHNPHTHDITSGYETTLGAILEKIDNNPLIDGLTISGGEPFLQPHVLSVLASEAQKRNLSVLTYTGYTWENLIKHEKFMPLIKNSDYIIDGKFEASLRTLELFFKGSSNQRLIDIQQSLAQNRLVEVPSFKI